MIAPGNISGRLWPVCCFLFVFLLAACSAGPSHSSLPMMHKPTQVKTTQAPGTPAGSPADSNRCINAALGPGGIRLLPLQGPLVHLTANGTGDEWGTLFNFPIAGCWDLHAMRDQAFGDLWLDVL